jgi:putative DNA primase/helicase
MDSHHIDLRTLQAALGGRISGGQVLCPGPNHSKADRSLAVKPAASGGFVVHSFSGDNWRICRTHVSDRLGWRPGWRPLFALSIERIKYRINSKVERAKAIWSGGQDPRGTLAERYLKSRKLRLPAELCGPTLRFHPRCPWRSGDKVESIPCLIAAFTSISNDTVTGIHRIRLDRPECWPKVERKMLGSVRGSAIMLDPAKERLAVAEGVESALAARQLGFGATWALGSAREFAPIDGVNELVILGEGDAASRKAAEACARLWQDQGRAVSLAVPASGGDFNDLLMVAR